jgi:hypothetical protein
VGFRLGDADGLEPTTSYVTGTFGLISLLSVDVYRCPSLLGILNNVSSADVSRCPPMYARYASLMLHLLFRFYGWRAGPICGARTGLAKP